MCDSNQYLDQLKIVLQELKKFKEPKGIAGDMDLLEEIRKAYNLLTDLSYDWNTGMKEVHKIWGYYILNSGISDKEKENNWMIHKVFGGFQNGEK